MVFFVFSYFRVFVIKNLYLFRIIQFEANPLIAFSYPKTLVSPSNPPTL